MGRPRRVLVGLTVLAVTLSAGALLVIYEMARTWAANLIWGPC